jgi:dihydrodipicolinate synthase/N-acetylneuraminate lyase
MKIDGVIVPLLTPLTSGRDVDDDSLARLIEHTIGGGVAAILLLGSTGEAPTLKPAHREQLVRTASSLVAGRVPLLVGVIEAGTDLATEQACIYQRAGADAVVPTAPMYFRHSQSELAHHFTAIAEAVTVPVFVYNIPPLVKLSLTPELVLDLAHVPGIGGLKDSEGNLDVFQRYLGVRDVVDGFQVWQGAEPVAAISVVRGADGVILGLANVAPRLAAELYLAAARGDLAAAWRLQDQLMRLFAIQRHKSFLAGLKAAGSLLGLCADTLSRPFERLDDDQVEHVRATLTALDLLPPVGVARGLSEAVR